MNMVKLVIKNTFVDQGGDAWDDAAPLSVGPRQINGWEARIATNEGDIAALPTTYAPLTHFSPNGVQAEMLSNGTTKVATANTGLDVFGTAIDIDNSADSAAVGVFLRNSLGGAHIQISSGNFSLLQTDENGITEEAWISGNKNGGVTLNHNGSPSIGTIGTGVNIIGTEINLSGKPTITGSRGGNTALTDLLTSLAAIGLITDSSTN
jgi:hypothetical protein